MKRDKYVQASIDSYIPNGDIKGSGVFHIERMSDDHIWISVAGQSFDLKIEDGMRISMKPQSDIQIKTIHKQEVWK